MKICDINALNLINSISCYLYVSEISLFSSCFAACFLYRANAQSAEFRKIDAAFKKNSAFQAVGEATVDRDTNEKALSDLSERRKREMEYKALNDRNINKTKAVIIYVDLDNQMDNSKKKLYMVWGYEVR